MDRHSRGDELQRAYFFPVFPSDGFEVAASGPLSTDTDVMIAPVRGCAKGDFT